MQALPKKLCRKAVISHFTKLTASQWEWLFAHEKKNGLHALRVKGNFGYKAYYRTEGIIQWLVSEDHYVSEEFKPERSNSWSALHVKTHSLGI